MAHRITTLALVSLLVALPSVAAPIVLGQTALNSSIVDGVEVPTGTTVLSPSRIQTASAPAAVHLSTGQTLNLGPNSSARLESASGGRISLAAETGTVEVGTQDGEVFQLALNAVAMLDDNEPGSGQDVVMIEVCDKDGNLIEWDAADIKNCKGCDLPENGVCKDKPTLLGISVPVAIGIGVGAGVLGFVIADDDDDTQVLLCGVPDASGNVPPGTNPPGQGGCPA